MPKTLTRTTPHSATARCHCVLQQPPHSYSSLLPHSITSSTAPCSALCSVPNEYTPSPPTAHKIQHFLHRLSWWLQEHGAGSSAQQQVHGSPALCVVQLPCQRGWSSAGAARSSSRSMGFQLSTPLYSGVQVSIWCPGDIINLKSLCSSSR
jgi:hypothetical protein